MDSDTIIEILIMGVMLVGGLLKSHFDKIKKAKNDSMPVVRKPMPAQRPHRELDKSVPFNASEQLSRTVAAVEAATAKAPKPAAALFDEGQRATSTPRTDSSPIGRPHVNSKEQRRRRALQRLGLKSKEDLRRAIVCGEILKPKYHE